MKIRRISCSMGRTINMGNFESLRVDNEFAAQIEEGEDLDDCWEQLVKHTRKHLRGAVEVAKDAWEEDEVDED